MTISNTPDQGNPLRLAVLLLAAGKGSRLGSHPKGLLKKDGITLLRRFACAITPFHPVEFVVVSGFHADAIELEVKQVQVDFEIAITILRNPHAIDGQASSVRLGLESLKSRYDVLMVALSDQPQIDEGEIASLLKAFSHRSEGKEIILPMVHGQRGNPVLFSRAVIESILSTPTMVCRTYMDAYPEQVSLMQSSSQAYISDVDTLEDIRKHGLTLN